MATKKKQSKLERPSSSKNIYVGSREKTGYAWNHVLSADETEANRLELFYKRAKKTKDYDYKIVKKGNVYEIYTRRF